MKKTVIVTLLFFLLFIPILVEAEVPTPPDVSTLGPVLNILPTSGSTITILSPLNSGNYSNRVQLIFVLDAIGLLGQFGNVGVGVDGGVINSVTNFMDKSVDNASTPDKWSEWYWYRTRVLASVMLPSLSEGTHNATIYYGWEYLYPSSQRFDVEKYASVIFNVVNAQATDLNTVNYDISSSLKPEITISSPSNKSINEKSLPFVFSISYNRPIAKEESFSYSLDGQEKAAISNINGSSQFNLMLYNLTDGLHSLTIYAQATYWHYGLSSDNSSVQFTIDTTPPTIYGLSVLNKTFNQKTVPLSFNVDENTSWIGYNLDNLGNVTLQGNITLTGLAFGNHSIIVYANDTLGNLCKSEIINFTIKEPETLSTVAIGVMVLVVAVLGSGALVYFKKYKSKTKLDKKP